MLIQTQPNPIEVSISCHQLLGALHALFTHPADTELIRQREVKMIAGAMERSIAFRERNPRLDHRFIDLKYSDLTADPLAAMRKIYQHIDAPLSEPALARMRELISGRGRYQRAHNP